MLRRRKKPFPSRLLIVEQLTIYVFILPSLFSLGCGSRPAKSTMTPSPTISKRALPPEKTAAVADGTRSSTLNRRGSWSLTSEKVREISPLVSRASRDYGIPPDIIYAVIWVESRFNPRAVSPVGAKGLMQLMPKTAKYLAERIEWDDHINEFKPEFNISAGSYYIARLIEQFDGNEDLALAAYNAGPTKVRRWLENGSLPKVAVEYATMVQTARTFFGGTLSEGYPGGGAREPKISDHDLDRLGLTILIAGLSDTRIGLEREDDPKSLEQQIIEGETKQKTGVLP